MVCTRPCLVAIALAGVMAAGTHSTVLAQQEHQPQTQPVTGTFTGSPVNARQRTCAGADGPYLEIRGHFSGAIASSDPRLTGNLDFMANPALVNLATGLGTFRGRFRVSDPASGRLKAEGEFFTVVTEASLNHGFAIGNVINTGGAVHNFFANFQSTFDLALNVTGHFGGAGDPRLPAVVQSGGCTGPFTKVP